MKSAVLFSRGLMELGVYSGAVITRNFGREIKCEIGPLLK